MKRPGCTLIGIVTAKAGKREELQGILVSFVAPARAEEGCVSYDLRCAADNPDVFVFYECFINRAALDRHSRQPYLNLLKSRAAELLAKPIEVRFLSMLSERADAADGDQAL